MYQKSKKNTLSGRFFFYIRNNAGAVKVFLSIEVYCVVFFRPLETAPVRLSRS
jgi:hypothetical protein